MSRIKQFTTKVHKGLLDISTLIMLLMVLLIGYGEAHMMSTYELIIRPIQGLVEPPFFYVLRNAIIPGLSSLCTMLLPYALVEFKKPTSSGGEKIDLLESFYLTVLAVVAGTTVYLTWSNLHAALDGAYAKEVFDEIAKEYYSNKIDLTIFCNAVVDFLVGLTTIKETLSHNKAVKSGANSRSGTSTTTSLTTTTPPPLGIPEDYVYTLSKKNTTTDFDLVKLHRNNQDTSSLRLDANGLNTLEREGKYVMDPLRVSVTAMGSMKTVAARYNLDISFVKK